MCLGDQLADVIEQDNCPANKIDLEPLQRDFSIRHVQRWDMHGNTNCEFISILLASLIMMSCRIALIQL